MKKIQHLLYTLVFAILSATTFGQETQSPMNSTPVNKPVYEMKKNYIKMDLLSPIIRNLKISYERVLPGNKSISLVGSYSDNLYTGNNNDYLQRISIQPEYRIYYSPKAKGAEHGYIALCARYQNMNLETSNSVYDLNTNTYTVTTTTRLLETAGAGFTIGYQEMLTTKKNIGLDMYFGFIWNSGSKYTRDSLGVLSNENQDFKPYVGYFIHGGFAITFGI